MEQIGEILARFHQDTQNPKNSDDKIQTSEPEESPDSILTARLRRFNIATFEHTFEVFNITNDTKEAYEALKSLANGKSSRKFILLYGMTGCGKTHLIEAAIITWVKQGIPAYYLTFSEIARQLKTELRKGGDWYDERFKTLCNAHILIIDDIGMGTTESRFEISDLEDIIDYRYRRRYYPTLNWITIIATNKDIKELPDRIVSRFYDPEFGAVLYMGDKDYRRRKI